MGNFSVGKLVRWYNKSLGEAQENGYLFSSVQESGKVQYKTFISNGEAHRALEREKMEFALLDIT